MNAFLSKFLSLTVLISAIGLPSPGKAQTNSAPLGNSPLGTGSVSGVSGWAEQEKLAKAMLRFADEPMDTARARKISRAGGFRFLGWSTCAGLQNCFVATVKGRRGGVFRYIVHGDRCVSIAGDPIQAPTRGQATSGPASDRIEAPRTAQPGDEDAAQPKRKHCFGGYSTIARTRLHSSFLIDRNSYFYKTDRIWQTLKRSKWQEIATFSIMDWRHPRPNSPSVEIGYAYQVLNADKELLEDAGEIVYSTPGSGSGEYKRDRAEMCEQQRNLTQNRLSKEAYLKSAATCYAIPFPTQTSIEIGEGLSINVSKEVDWCTVNQNYQLEDAKSAAQATYDDCMENPGRYDPKNFKPVPDPFSLESVLGSWEPLQPISSPDSCNITKTTETANQVGRMICTVTIKETCNPSVTGCPCETTDTSVTCVEGGDIGTPIE